MNPGWIYDAQGEGVRFHRTGDMFVAEWDGLGVLRASADGSDAEFTSAEGADPGVLAKHRRIVDALVRHLRGRLTFHAAAVAHRDVGIAFLGDQGAGKSTLAAAMGQAGETGLLADDCLPVDLRSECAYAEPSDESHWLDAPASAALRLRAIEPGGAKSCYAPLSRQARPARLAAVVKLVFDDALRSPELHRGGGSDSFLALRAAMFRFALFDGEVLARDLDQLSQLARCVPVYTLRRPRRFEALHESVRLLTSLLQVGS